jgi:hypothetical protein
VSSDRRRLYGGRGRRGGGVRRRPSTRVVGTAVRLGHVRKVYANVESPETDRAIFLTKKDPASSPNVPTGTPVPVQWKGKRTVARKALRTTLAGGKAPVGEWVD